jgi:hypothetical protein
LTVLRKHGSIDGGFNEILLGGNMRRFNLSLMIGGTLVAGAFALTTPAEAQYGVDVLGGAAAVAGAIAGGYFWGGHQYCWYPDGWNGPGWYWCGEYSEPGVGWGGGEGWHGWHRGAEHGHGGGPKGGPKGKGHK